MSETNKPVTVLRDGNLKAAVFRNEGEKGPFFSVSLSRTYTNERGEFQDSHVLSGTDLLRGSELLRKSYDVSRDLQKEAKREGADRPSGDLFKGDRKQDPRARESFDRESRRPRTRQRELRR